MIICPNCRRKVTPKSLTNNGNFFCPKCGANCNKELKEKREEVKT